MELRWLSQPLNHALQAALSCQGACGSPEWVPAAKHTAGLL